MGESITEGTITKWLKKPGDAIQRDEPLFEISTDKVDAEIPSPSAGTLKEIKIAEGTTVQINTVVCTIDGSRVRHWHRRLQLQKQRLLQRLQPIALLQLQSIHLRPRRVILPRRQVLGPKS